MIKSLFFMDKDFHKIMLIFFNLDVFTLTSLLYLSLIAIVKNR